MALNGLAEDGGSVHVRRRRPLLAAIGVDSVRFLYHVVAVAGLLYFPQLLLGASDVMLYPFLFIYFFWTFGEPVTPVSVEYLLSAVLLQISALGVGIAYVVGRRPTRGMAFSTRRYAATWPGRAILYRIPLAVGLVILVFLLLEISLCPTIGFCLSN